MLPTRPTQCVYIQRVGSTVAGVDAVRALEQL